MAMPGGDDGDASAEIKERVAVHVLHEHPFSAPRHQRIIAQIRRRNKLVVQGQDPLGLGAGKGRLYVRFLLHRSWSPFVCSPKRRLRRVSEGRTKGRRTSPHQRGWAVQRSEERRVGKECR